MAKCSSLTRPGFGKYNRYIDYEDIISFGSTLNHLVPLLLQEAFERGEQINSSQKAVVRVRVCAQSKRLFQEGALQTEEAGSTSIKPKQRPLRFSKVWWRQFNYFKVHTRDRCGERNTCVTTRNRRRPWTPHRTSWSAWSVHEWVYSLNPPVGGRTGHRPAPGTDGGSSRVIRIRHQVSDTVWIFWII